jgi:hypothetical protein
MRRKRKSNGGTWVNWIANNSKVSRVCNNPYTNALTTNAHVSVAVYVSRQPTCLVYVFRVAVRETYKSCGCFVFICIWAAKVHIFLHTPKLFGMFLTDSCLFFVFCYYFTTIFRPSRIWSLSLKIPILFMEICTKEILMNI